MDKELYFCRLDVHQAAVVIPIFEITAYVVSFLALAVTKIENEVIINQFLGIKSSVLYVEVALDVHAGIFLVSILISLSLLIGVEKGRRLLMLPWLLFTWLRLVGCIFAAWQVIRAAPQVAATHLSIFSLFASIFGMLLYCLVVVTKSFSLSQFENDKIYKITETDEDKKSQNFSNSV